MDRKNITLADATAMMLNRVDSLEEKLATVLSGYVAPKIVNQDKLAEILDVSKISIIKYVKLGWISEIKVGSACRYDVAKVIQELQRKKRIK